MSGVRFSFVNGDIRLQLYELTTFVSSGIPFDTEIGVGKVIRGWDEGAFTLNVVLEARFR